MKNRLISLLACLALCMALFVPVCAAVGSDNHPISEDELTALNAAQARSEASASLTASVSEGSDLPSSPLTRSVHCNMIVPHLTTLFQGAVVGADMHLRFLMFSFGYTSQRWGIQIYAGTSSTDGELVAYTNDYYSNSIGTENLSLTWETNGLSAGTYTVYYYTISSSGNIYSDTISSFNVYLYNAAKPLTNVYLYTDDIKTPVTSLTLKKGEEADVDVFFDPYNTTEDKYFEVESSNTACVSAENFAGSIDLTAEGYGYSEIYVYAGNYVATLRVLVPQGVAYPVTGGNIYFDDTTGTITGCEGSVTAADIPSSINGVAVTSIGSSAFEGCKNLASVKIPDSVKTIDYCAFYGCTALKNVSIADGVETIGYGAFADCGSLTAVTIPDSVNTIDYYAFAWCNALKTVTIGNGVESIGVCAFSYCENLESIVIPASVTFINEFAFSECTKLKKVYFLGDAPEIGSCVFQTYSASGGYNYNIPGLTLYYLEGKEGWTTPTWNGYPTATWTGFVDVSTDAWYAGSVDYIVKSGLMNGMGKNEFRPEVAMTRAMLVTVLWRYAGSPVEGANTFGDLTQNWYVQAVAWAANNGIVTGYPDGTFRPDDEVTREQLATILYRYCNTVGIDTSARADLASFPDGDKINAYANDPISWAVSSGLITGITHGGNPTAYLEPQGSATRAQVATILMRFIENVAE